MRNLPGFTDVDRVIFVHAFDNHPVETIGTRWDPYHFDLIAVCDETKEPRVRVIPDGVGVNVILVVLVVKKNDNDHNEVAI
jgi:hypothetical protein